MLAVTTRNKLRSWRYSLPMMRARGYVREQLAATPGLIRYVSAIASPTEFLTMTVWENRQAMFNFMSSGAHQEFMWMFSRWSASFWSMRWNVGIVGLRSFWILTLWRAAPEGQGDVVRLLRQRLGASWTMCWRAGEYEIGNWNGLRLRQLASARSRELRMH